MPSFHSHASFLVHHHLCVIRSAYHYSCVSVCPSLDFSLSVQPSSPPAIHASIDTQTLPNIFMFLLLTSLSPSLHPFFLAKPPKIGTPPFGQTSVPGPSVVLPCVACRPNALRASFLGRRATGPAGHEGWDRVATRLSGVALGMTTADKGSGGCAMPHTPG